MSGRARSDGARDEGEFCVWRGSGRSRDRIQETGGVRSRREIPAMEMRSEFTRGAGVGVGGGAGGVAGRSKFRAF